MFIHKPDEVLIYYDRPLLFTLKSEESDNGEEVWICSPIMEVARRNSSLDRAARIGVPPARTDSLRPYGAALVSTISAAPSGCLEVDWYLNKKWPHSRGGRRL